MKKIFSLLFAMISISSFLYAQTTNIFPSTGNVGIGISYPTDKLSVNGEKNRRLGGIPSADEVEKNGFNLGELNAKLLQKMKN